jgi:hypothetical protein
MVKAQAEAHAVALIAKAIEAGKLPAMNTDPEQGGKDTAKWIATAVNELAAALENS